MQILTFPGMQLLRLGDECISVSVPQTSGDVFAALIDYVSEGQCVEHADDAPATMNGTTFPGDVLSLKPITHVTLTGMLTEEGADHAEALKTEFKIAHIGANTNFFVFTGVPIAHVATILERVIYKKMAHNPNVARHTVWLNPLEVELSAQ